MKPTPIDWDSRAASMLNGRTIVEARYLTKQEAAELGWETRSVVLFLDNGNQLIASGDDEGNQAGALFTSDEKTPILPVLYR